MMMSLERFLNNLRVAKRSTGYKYIKMFEEELKKEGLIDVKVVGRGKRIFVKDADKILNFFEDRGIYL